MQDYGRTTELVNAANNAAGASNEQFSKTLDSLESKVEKLKNSWHTFTLGLMNNELIKGVIEALNDFITIINKITQGWDSFSGGALKLGLVVGALYAGDKALKVFTTSLKSGATIFQSFGAVGKATIDGLKLKIQQLKGLFNKSEATNSLNATMQKLNTQLGQGSTVLNRYNQNLKAQNVMAKQKAQLDAQLISGAITQTQYEERLNQQTVIQNTLKKEQTAIEAAYATQLGIDQTVMSNYLGIKSSNLLLDKKESRDKVALILASQGYTAQQLAEMNVKKRNNILTAATIVANKSEATTKLGGAIASGLTSVAMKLEERSKNGSTVATWLLTVANRALKKSLKDIILVILPVVAALALLVAGIFLIIKAIKKAKENSPEGQLKKAQEALENMTKAADAAAESYNKLNDSLTELDDKYKALDELTVGTQEWRDAVAEVNTKVMDLINTYPQLASAVDNVNGVLEINKDRQAEILSQKFQEKQLAANVQLAQEQEVIQKQQEVNFEALSDRARVGLFRKQSNYNYDFMLDNKEETNPITKQLAVDLAQGMIFTNQTELEKYLKPLIQFNDGVVEDDRNTITKLLAADVFDFTDELKAFGNSLIEANKQIEAYSEAMAANTATMLEFDNSTQQSVVSNLMTGDLFKQYEDKFSDDLDDVKAKDLKDNTNYRAYVQDTYGYNAKIGDDGEIITTDGTIDAENAKQGYAQYKATKELADVGETLKDFQANLNKIQETALLDRSGKRIKKGDIQTLLGLQIDTTGLSDEVAQEVKRAYRESVNAANLALIKATEEIDAVVAKNIQFSDRLTTDAISGLSDHLVDVAFISGDTIATELNNNITSILDTLTDSQIDTFMTTLNSIDWTDKSGILNFATMLQEAGLEVTNNMYELQDSIITATNATYKLNFKDLQEKLNSLGQVINNIRSGEQGRTFSEEDYNTIINALPSQIGNFVKTLDGNYQYIGSSMDNLIEALDNNTNAILNEKLMQLSGSKELNKFLTDNPNISSGLDNKTAEQLLETINTIITEVGGDALELLGINNFSKDFSKLITLSTEELRQLVDDIITRGKDYSKSEEEKYVNLLATDYQKLSERGIVANFQGIVQQYQTNGNDGYSRLQLEGISRAIAANAYSMGLSDTDVSDFQNQINNLIEGSMTQIDVKEFLSKFINEPWKETFGELAQLSNITDYYNNQLSSLQETYDELVDSQAANGKELYNNLARQQAIYNALNNTIKDNIDANNNEIAAYEKRYKYLSTETDLITGQKMAVLNTSQLGDTSAAVAEEHFEEYKKLIETNNSLQTSQKQNLINIRKNQKKAEEYYNNAISTVRDSLIAQRESQIEALSNINDTINSVSDSIVSGMREAISEDRQARENAEQLQSIQDKEVQLAYLQATSGSQVEILALQKEIASEQQSYQDSLIDQQIDAMEKASEQAANQREKQINIAQAQFDYWKNNESWSKAQQAVDAAISDPTNRLQTELQNLISATNKNLNPDELQDKLNEFSSNLHFSESFSQDGFVLGSNAEFNESIVTEMVNKLPAAIVNAIIGNQTGDNGTSSGYKEGEKETYDKYVNNINKALTSSDLDTVQHNISNDKTLSDETKQTLTDKVTAARKELPTRKKEDYERKIDNISSIERAATLVSEVTDTFNSQDTNYIKEDLLQKIGKKQKDLLKNTVYDTNLLTSYGAPIIKSDSLTDRAVMIRATKGWGKPGTDAQKARVENAQPGQLFIWGKYLHIRGNNPDLGYISTYSDEYDYYYNKLKNTYYDLNWLPYMAFKTGGLANFTGPAWLDGTPSAPELVLNSTDTKNFIQLRDILSEILKPGTTQNTTNNEGDTYIDIDINVDELANDYDVDEVAERVQEIIVRDANYRNVNNVYLNK